MGAGEDLANPALGRLPITLKGAGEVERGDCMATGRQEDSLNA